MVRGVVIFLMSAALQAQVTTVETPVPGLTTSVNSLNTSVAVGGSYAGSVRGGAALTGPLTLRDAIARGLEFNLGKVGSTQAVRQAHGQMRVARSSLLPNLTAGLREDVQQTNLRALGLRFNTPVPGLSFPTIVGPFNYFDLRATLTQTVMDVSAIDNYRSAEETVKANAAAKRDAEDLVVYAVAGAYLQAIAAEGRLRLGASAGRDGAGLVEADGRPAAGGAIGRD